MTRSEPAAHVATHPSHHNRRTGYAVALGVNAVMLYVVNQLLGWGWPPFLTADFDRLLPIVNVSLVASILVNLVYLSYDPAWFKSLCQIGLAGISLAVFARTLQVFPFDFSAYAVNWEAVARTVLILGMIGVAIGIVATLVTFVVRVARDAAPPREPRSLSRRS